MTQIALTITPAAAGDAATEFQVVATTLAGQDQQPIIAAPEGQDDVTGYIIPVLIAAGAAALLAACETNNVTVQVQIGSSGAQTTSTSTPQRGSVRVPIRAGGGEGPMPQ